MRLIGSEKGILGDSTHMVYTDDYFSRFGAELHRFTNAGGVPYSAIYRNGSEEMSCERQYEDQMIKDFRARIYTEVTDGRRDWQWGR
jgi:hypothetical protein